MFVTELGMVTEVRLEQFLKALMPILVTELGIVTEVRLVQKANVYMIDNQIITLNTVEKSCGFRDGKGKGRRFNVFNLL